MTTRYTPEAIEYTKLLLGDIRKFKIGKTGKPIWDKFDNEPEYIKNFDEIFEISKSTDEKVIDKMEVDFIKYFLQDSELKSKCKNQRKHIEGNMETTDGFYRLYVVIKN